MAPELLSLEGMRKAAFSAFILVAMLSLTTSLILISVSAAAQMSVPFDSEFPGLNSNPYMLPRTGPTLAIDPSLQNPTVVSGEPDPIIIAPPIPPPPVVILPPVTPTPPRFQRMPYPVTSADAKWWFQIANDPADVELFYNDEILVEVQQLEKQQLFSIHGPIGVYDRTVLNQAISRLQFSRPILLNAVSPGGSDITVNELVRGLNAKCPKAFGCQITTQVKSNAYCASFCIYVFMMGSVRRAGPDARFGFHAATQYDLNNPTVKVPAIGRAEDLYASTGVSRSWMKKHKTLFMSVERTYLTPSQMRGSNIVTHITE